MESASQREIQRDRYRAGLEKNGGMKSPDKSSMYQAVGSAFQK